MRLKVNDIDIFLKPGENIQLTRSNAEIAKLGNRSGSFTTDFQVPMTQSNIEALGYSDSLQNNSTISPSKRQEAVLTRETGGEIAMGFVQIVKADPQKKEFTLAFFTGNISWIDELRGNSIRDIWLRDFDHAWTEANIVASWTNTDGYIYPFIDYGRLTYQLSTNTFIDDWYPAVFQHTLITRMFEKIGWVAKGSFIDSWAHKHTIIPFVNEAFLEDNADSLVAQAQKTSLTDYEIVELTASATDLSQTDTLDIDTIVTDNIGAFSLPLDRYTADRTLNNAVFVFTIPGGTASVGFGAASSTTGTITLQIEKNGTVIESEQLVTATGSGSVSQSVSGDFVITTTQNLVNGDYIDASVLLEYSGAVVGVTVVTIRLSAPAFYFQLANVDGGLLPGGNVTLANNLPDIDQADFVKDMIVRHGLLAIADQYSRTVTFEPFDKIVNNQNSAQDLSDYVNVLNETNIDFTRIINDYGKKSRFLYADPNEDDSYLANYNDTYSIPYGGGQLIIDNDFIESIKDIYQSPFEATYQIGAFPSVIFGDVQIPYIPRISYDGSDTLRTGARILLVVQNTSISDFAEGRSTVSIDGTVYTETAFAYFNKPLLNSSLDNIDVCLAYDLPEVYPQSGVGLLQSNYNNWLNILNNPRYIEVGVKLFPHQFETIDLSLPIYLNGEKIKGYFMLDQIIYRDGSDVLRLIQIQ